MKQNQPIFLIAIIICSVLTGCGKSCEEFNSNILKWMPYEKGETLITQKNGILDSLTVIDSEILHTDKIGFRSKCDCEDSYSIRIKSDSLQIRVVFYQTIDVSDSYITLNNENLNFTEQVNTYSFNGKSYSNVLIYENVSHSETRRFDKVLISNSIGIIGIIGTTEEWTINDDSIKSIDISAVDQIITDC